MAGNRFDKNPEAVLDYSVNWAAWLKDDTIQTSTWIVPDGIEQHNEPTHTDTVTTIWLKNGTPGEVYTLFNQITTVGGRTEGRRLFIPIVEK